jgi:malate permease and related proteins
MNQQFLVSTVVIALGWVLKRFLIDERGAQVLVRLVFNVTLPALVIRTFDNVSIEPSLGLLPGIAVAYGLFMAGLGSLVLFRKRPRKERGQLSMLLPGFNIGLFAYPLVEASLGAGALKYLAMFDVGTAFATFGVAYAIAGHYSREGARLDLAFAGRQLLGSVPFVVYVLTLLMGIAGIRFPGLLLDASGVLARANMPLSLLVLGMYLGYDTRPGQWRGIGSVLGTRYLVGLAAGVALFLLLPFDATFRTILLVCLVLPPPLIEISYAVQFGYDVRFVGLLLNVANLASYFLLWALFNVLR